MLIKFFSKYGGSIILCDVHAEREPKHLTALVRAELCDEEPARHDGCCIPCREILQWVEAEIEMRKLLTSGELTHTRFRHGYIYGYRRDPNSPSGVMCAAVLDEPRFDRLTAELRAQGVTGCALAPLSPTEGL